MKESVAVAKEADTKKEFSPTKSDKSIHRVRDEPERQFSSLRSVIGNIRHDGGTPSLDSIATELSSMHTAQRASVLLALQRTHGNRYVQRVVAGIQAKLKVGQPGDKYEQEADRVAEQVMQMPEPQVQRQLKEEEEEEEEPIQTKSLAEPISPLIQRQVEPEEEEEQIQTKPIAEQITPIIKAEEEDEEETLQAKKEPGQTPTAAPNIEGQINAMRGGGRSLSKSTRAFFEPRFGYDFSEVRVRTDSAAVQAADSIGAKAFTAGRNIVFGSKVDNPEASVHRQLLAHELAHLVQQDKGSVRPTAQIEGVPINDNPQLENEADKLASEVSHKHFNGNVKPSASQLIPAIASSSATVQLNADSIPSSREEQEALRRMEQDIAVAEQLLREDISEDERERIRRAIANARVAVENYRNLRDQGQTRTATMAGIGVAAVAIVADDATVVGTIDDPLLILLGLAAIATLIATRSPASQDVVAEAWRQTGQAIGDLASAIETIVWMTAAGNVIHDHIVEEARELAVQLGLAASAAAVTREMLCEMLRSMATQNRRTNTDKWKKIISTMKGLGCRPSRVSR